MKWIIVRGLVFSSLMLSCNGQPSPSENVDQYIDSSIAGIERTEISNFIRSLPLDSRDNVMLLPDNSSSLFVNRQVLRNDLLIGSTNLNLQSRINTQANLVPICKASNNGGNNQNGGIFHTVIGDVGYKSASMEVQLPLETDVLSGEDITSTNDTPTIYLGGWGNGERFQPSIYNNNTPDYGSAVDFGLKHNRQSKTWGIIGLFDTSDEPNRDTYKIISKPYNLSGLNATRFQPGDRVKMQFGVTNLQNENYIVLTIQRINGAPQKITVGKKAMGSLRDWTSTAPKMRIKRSVSIAQTTTNAYGFAVSAAFLKVKVANFSRITTSGQTATGGWYNNNCACKIPDYPNSCNGYQPPSSLFAYGDLVPRVSSDTNAQTEAISLVTNGIYLNR
jgi:hypothetical protein